MTCKYCNGKLAPLRSLTDGEYCSDEHRQAYQAEHPETCGIEDGNAVEQALPTAFDSGAPAPPASNRGVPSIKFSVPAPEADANPALVSDEPVIASDSALDGEPESQAAAPWAARKLGSLREFVPAWLVRAWTTAPTELKAMALLLPVLVALACSASLPNLRGHFPEGKADALRQRVRQTVSEQWKFVAERISNRAAIAIIDDFRSGLDSWQSRANLTTSWSFDRNGFVEPGPLAILKPTEDLTDYSFEFLGEVEHRAVGAAFRARDLDNYYAVKFIEDRSGSMPALHLVRYAVINGREGPHVEKALPSSIRADMLNRFGVEVRGSDFTILAQGEVVDFYSDRRLTSGGVGFFCSRGEKARLRWVEVSHQYDTLGRLCAFLAPVSLEGVGKD